MSNTNIKATAYTQPNERTIFRLAPPRHGRTASKRECYEFENTAVDRTCDLAAQYGIDLGEVREWLTANPSHAAWVRTFAREGGHSCPTTLIAVRDLVPISPDVWLVQLVKAPFDQDRRATSALKHLAWQVVRGVWPPQVGPDLHDYNAAVAEALYPPMARLRHVLLPQLAPFIAAAARNGLAIIWKIVLVVEFLGRSSGVGFQIHMKFQLFDIAGVLAYALAFVAIMLAIDYLVIQPAERRATRWRRA